MRVFVSSGEPEVRRGPWKRTRETVKLARNDEGAFDISVHSILLIRKHIRSRNGVMQRNPHPCLRRSRGRQAASPCLRAGTCPRSASRRAGRPKGEENGPLGPSPYLRRRVWVETLASKPFCRNAQWNFLSLRRDARIETRHPCSSMFISLLALARARSCPASLRNSVKNPLRAPKRQTCLQTLCQIELCHMADLLRYNTCSRNCLRSKFYCKIRSCVFL